MKKILIVNANYYKKISENLIFSTKKKLFNSKFKVSILEVPGAYEIPIAISKNIKKFDGFVALGCVIKGQTPHFDLICSSIFNTILSLSIKYNKPIGNGVITALNLKQAIQRSKKDNSKIIPMLVFIIQREDCYGFTPNFEKDPLYSNELKKAYELGLTVKAVMLKMSPKNVKYVKEVPVIL